MELWADVQGKSLIINKVKKVKLELLDTGTEIVKIRNKFLSNCEDDELKEKLRKIHVMTSHKQEETLIRFLKFSLKFQPES